MMGVAVLPTKPCIPAVRADILERARERISRARGLLIDLDGTLIHAEGPLPGAREFLARHGHKAIIISNNSSDSAETLRRRLLAADIDIPASRLVLAGLEAIAVAAARWPGSRVHMCAAAPLRAAAADAGLIVTEERPDLVIIARDERFDYAALRAAANAVNRGAIFIATNPDGAHPGPRRQRIPETGALTAAVAAAAGRQPDLVVGKPDPALFRKALGILGVTAAEAVMIGDNPDTDGRGADAVAMTACIVDEHLTLAGLLRPE
jgi:HAD superfamily hydrolase (TIGR01450 family)